MNILLTGGLGYIGSHVAVTLALNKHKVIIFDNLSNSHISNYDNIKALTSDEITFVEGDINDYSLVRRTISEHKISSVVHLAGYKAVGESTKDPYKYYSNNIGGTFSLLKAMLEMNVSNLVFSSSATVYGKPKYLPLDEKHSTTPFNPYGNTKLMIEIFLEDIATSRDNLNFISLRYFNPVGSHESGLIGDHPKGIPNNLMPYINKVAAKEMPFLKIFGNDYATPDGTGIRDYIHVDDLSNAHLAALVYLEKKADKPNNTLEKYNIGTGTGYSVLNIVDAYEKVNNIKIPYEIMPRREGDLDSFYADVSKANKNLKWRSIKTLEDMCLSSWDFQKKIL